ncbi:UNVERIFIED_CONTAM: hypothetical protein Sradi_6196600 [Sesamum radiatum]|uniref:Uncharacterized protein n=1 Tax=Sesamum radiatum TaxID=300843 RepID=A0AAW2K988_SESRA
MACAAARVDTSRINVNKASCISCIMISWGGTSGGRGSTRSSGTCSWCGVACPLSGGCSRGGGFSPGVVIVHRVGLHLSHSLKTLRYRPPLNFASS